MLMFKPLIFSLLTLFGISAKAAAGKWVCTNLHQKHTLLLRIGVIQIVSRDRSLDLRADKPSTKGNFQVSARQAGC
ncbi:hypothetical protein IWX50DRAFT_644891 [Phyllosticta citricarpa]